MADDRRLTLIVVPHGDLETRTLEIAYWKLKIGLALAIILLLGFGFVVATWFPIAAQASRVSGLERELAALVKEREQVAELADALAEVEAQYERVRQLLGADGAGREGDPILPPLGRDSTRAAAPPNTAAPTADSIAATLDLWPLASAGFVTRAQSAGRVGHPGLDIAVPRNSDIRAAGPGIVREAGEDVVYGHYALIDHGGGLQSLYGHASRIVVASGERVGRAQIIGYTGTSGRSSGPHLHFEVRKDGLPVDPLLYVKQP
jgi:murein DD-endopeptidase MepM/ murein hydrolase activator NlpD